MAVIVFMVVGVGKMPLPPTVIVQPVTKQPCCQIAPLIFARVWRCQVVREIRPSC